MAASQKKAGKSKKAEPALVAYKGFYSNLQCHGGFQYEVGQTYVHSGPVVQCRSGFHACQNPLDVLDYYGLENGNRFARVELSGTVDRGDDRKWAANQIRIVAELALPELIGSGIAWATAACKAGTLSRGHSATNASSGDYATNASSGHSATNASSGDYATNASSGHYATNASSGEHSVIAAAGRASMARGAKGVWISLAEYERIDGAWRCIGFATGQAGYDGVAADTWLIAQGGKLVPAGAI